jgi:hypothetical protein
MPRPNRATRIREAIDRAGDSGLSRAQLYRLLHGQISREELETILAALLAGDRYIETVTPTGGRPVTRYRRNTTRPGVSARTPTETVTPRDGLHRARGTSTKERNKRTNPSAHRA